MKSSSRAQHDEEGKIIGLRLAGVKLTREDFETVRNMPHLKWLWLSYMSLEDDQLAIIAGHPTLRNIRLDYTPISDAGLKHLETLPELQSVCMGNVDVSDAAIESLRKAQREKFGKRNIGIGHNRPTKE